MNMCRISCIGLPLVMAATVIAQDANPLTPKQIRLKEAAAGLKPWRIWLNEDVAYIITSEERRVFTQLSTDRDRERFVELFWLRRDPTPNTAENEYRDEHYRRIAYADEHYGGAGIPGRKTDRGRIYITYGPPEEVRSDPGDSRRHSAEHWSYHYIEGIGNDVILDFVDITGVGLYHLTKDPMEKAAAR